MWTSSSNRIPVGSGIRVGFNETCVRTRLGRRRRRGPIIRWSYKRSAPLMGYGFSRVTKRTIELPRNAPASILIGRERDSRRHASRYSFFRPGKILKSSPPLGNCACGHPSTADPLLLKFVFLRKNESLIKEKKNSLELVLAPPMGVTRWKEGKSISFRSQRCFYLRLMLGLFFRSLGLFLRSWNEQRCFNVSRLRKV